LETRLRAATDAVPPDPVGAMPRSAYLFRAGRRERLGADGPREFTYGYAELAAAGAPVAMIDEVELGIDCAWPRVAEAAANRVAALCGVHPRVLARLDAARTRLDGFDCVFATTHTLGLAAAALHRVGRLRAKPFIFTMGLIEPQTSDTRIAWLRRLLRGTTLATLSLAEAAALRERLGPEVEVQDFVFGVDLDFWTPLGEDAEDVVLSIGNDWNRDFATLVEAWRPEFPRLTIITALPVDSRKPNVRVERGDWRSQAITDVRLRERLRRARLVVVPLRDTLQPSGQSASMQAMACARPVVLTANRGLWDRAQLERHGACSLVPPGDAVALATAVATLLADHEAARSMGLRARRMLEIEDVSSAAMARQVARLAGTTRKAG
jgi:glycosyltransferase involved in cell wall biosynthesis